jgi:thiol-disulfide isomerase/thioredoxin
MPIVKLLRLLKSWFGAMLLVAVLYFTGLLGAVSYYSQRVLLVSGLLNARPELKEKEPFPFDFNLQTLDGRQLNMHDLRGKVLFLNLWATWCGPCRAEMPGIEKLYTSETSDSIVFIMLSLDKRGDERKINNYLTEKGYTFPVYRPVGSLPEKLQVPSIPVTLVVNKKGNVVYRHVGAASYDTNRFKKFLKDLVDE